MVVPESEGKVMGIEKSASLSLLLLEVKSKAQETYLVIMHIFERITDHTDTHVDQVRGGHLEHLLRKLLTVLIDLLWWANHTQFSLGHLSHKHTLTLTMK